MPKRRINNEDRRMWVLNDEGLYNLQRRSGMSMTQFIRIEKDLIDECINNVLGGFKQAHYLAYGR